MKTISRTTDCVATITINETIEVSEADWEALLALHGNEEDAFNEHKRVAGNASHDVEINEVMTTYEETYEYPN